MSIEVVLSSIVFLVLVMAVILVFVNMAQSRKQPMRLPRPEISYPDPVPEPSSPEIVQGVDTTKMGTHIHNEEAAINTAIQGHRDFVRSMDTRELATPTLGIYTGNITDNISLLSPLE